MQPAIALIEFESIAIGMRAGDTMVKRAPVEVTYAGTVHPGKYLVAWHPKSSTENERNTIVYELKNGCQILTRQIAGAVARKFPVSPSIKSMVTR